MGAAQAYRTTSLGLAALLVHKGFTYEVVIDLAAGRDEQATWEFVSQSDSDGPKRESDNYRESVAEVEPRGYLRCYQTLKSEMIEALREAREQSNAAAA